MIIDGIQYDEKSIQVRIDDPKDVYVKSPEASPVTRKQMTIELRWNPQSYVADSTVAESSDGNWSSTIRTMCIGAVVEALVKKFDEAQVYSSNNKTA